MVLARVIFKDPQYSRQLSRHLRSFNPFQTRFPLQQNLRYNHTTRMDAKAKQEELLTFWFNRDPKDWYVSPPGFDDEIRDKYKDLIAEARSGALDGWEKEPQGVIALLLLLDQFPRNIFRGSGESFSSDEKALQIATRAVAQQWDKQLGKTSTAQQLLCYIPFMHAEDLVAQVAGVALSETMVSNCDEGSEAQEQAKQAVSFSRKHLECVAKLGRFPKRNDPLGRETTQDEVQFLKEFPNGF